MSINCMVAMWRTSSSRPTSWTCSGNGYYASPEQAYDNDPLTYAEIDSPPTGSNSETAIFTGFGSVNGTLEVIITTSTEDVTDDIAEAISSVSVYYSTDGSSYTNIGGGAGGNDLNCGTLSQAVSGSQLWVKVVCYSRLMTRSPNSAQATSRALIYDIKVS